MQTDKEVKTEDPAAGKVSSLLDCYVSYEGFYDLRDYNMPIKIFKKLWKIQGALFKMNQNKEYYKKWHPAQWQEAQLLSADYQRILFQYA